MIVLDPDFDTYAILSAAQDGSAFTFLIYDEQFSYGRAWLTGAVEQVECFDYSNIRGDFMATKGADGNWNAVRER